MADTSHITGNWSYPTAIRFGPGRIRELAEACQALGMKNPLLVTDRALADLDIVARAVSVCTEAGLGCAVYSDVQGNPVASNVEDGITAYRAGGHDGVIAFGGGSGMDTGKAIALMVGQSRPMWDFEDREDWWTRANADGIAPIVGVPTTSGTGSEVGRASVITDERDHTKKIIFHPRMLPSIVIADPELSVGLPAPVTAAVGMDALSHNLEAFCSPLYHPMADGIALQGMKLVHDWLPTAVADGNNIEARAHMMVASSMGATSFQKGLGAMHSLSHPCSAILGSHHGLTNAVVMPYVLEFNRSAIEGRMADLARYLDLPNPSFDSVMTWVLDLRKSTDIPHTLADIGMEEQYVEKFAAMAEVDPPSATNPIPVTAENLAGLYRDCMSGTLAASG
ncbi:MAG: iron-containing alcohol dehydrogenase [Rhodospirillaceae bacterium]|nr:iron-containing alcohol dehydrogenase [Rhodospirillaceae bacterium]MBT6138286.1 iron-containing alcohol dehydrogenase [Rhodospirillaceae bacterium]